VNTDLHFIRVENRRVKLEPQTPQGMVWLQTHFPEEDWEPLCAGEATLSSRDTFSLITDAMAAGLVVFYP